jgi:hypothetical protein
LRACVDHPDIALGGARRGVVKAGALAIGVVLVVVVPAELRQQGRALEFDGVLAGENGAGAQPLRQDGAILGMLGVNGHRLME